MIGDINFSPKDFEMIFVHEFGHALGFDGTTLHGAAGIETIGGAPYFTGQSSALAYRAILNSVGRQPAMTGLFVPMATDGTRGHWKYPDLAWDAMNPMEDPSQY